MFSIQSSHITKRTGRWCKSLWEINQLARVRSFLRMNSLGGFCCSGFPPALGGGGCARPTLPTLDCLPNDYSGKQRAREQPIKPVVVRISPGDVDNRANEKPRRQRCYRAVPEPPHTLHRRPFYVLAEKERGMLLEHSSIPHSWKSKSFSLQYLRTTPLENRSRVLSSVLIHFAGKVISSACPHLQLFCSHALVSRDCITS